MVGSDFHGVLHGLLGFAFWPGVLLLLDSLPLFFYLSLLVCVCGRMCVASVGERTKGEGGGTITVFHYLFFLLLLSVDIVFYF